MATQKTLPTDESVIAFINSVEDENKRKDGFALAEIMRDASGFEPKMWGPSIIGYGSYHYKYASGHEGEAPLAGFSPRKQKISFYVMLSPEKREELLPKLGKHKAAKGCIYINKLSDVDTEVVKEMVKESIRYVQELYPSSS
ncbi:DUF1801 domain-containing protein [Solitalea sp. MAHUQ-68]|uniref:DUF1801 domain-containing protein n=1 Tax=Solitalea agri TaxID=2953739 RepID=A0A9X2JFW7_9SPHI|nr:DUF1801 domain-containing protein [Solitalea agri]MCO4293861.1 DUF1801 domain-containing protein [Solitalea agri]